jgi:hypothetical protein
MISKPFTITISRSMLEGIYGIISVIIQSQPADDDDKLLLATLAEIRSDMHRRLDKVQQEYRFTLSPAKAIALRIMATNFCLDIKTYTGNKLHQLSNQIHKHYSN